MSDEITRELIRLIPTVLWVTVALVVVFAFRDVIRQQLLPRMSGFKAFGVEATFAREQLDKAVEKQDVDVSPDDRSQVIRRAERHSDILQGARILWVDDNPGNNIYVVELLNSFAVFVHQVRTTAEALSALAHDQYDLAISDMERDGVADEGLRFVKQAREHGLYRWTVFWIADYDPNLGTPPHALGITNRADHLLHYIMDALERERS
jgi:CheY-like chemotaxis protein